MTISTIIKEGREEKEGTRTRTAITGTRIEEEKGGKKKKENELLLLEEEGEGEMNT